MDLCPILTVFIIIFMVILLCNGRSKYMIETFKSANPSITDLSNTFTGNYYSLDASDVRYPMLGRYVQLYGKIDQIVNVDELEILPYGTKFGPYKIMPVMPYSAITIDLSYEYTISNIHIKFTTSLEQLKHLNMKILDSHGRMVYETKKSIFNDLI